MEKLGVGTWPQRTLAYADWCSFPIFLLLHVACEVALRATCMHAPDTRVCQKQRLAPHVVMVITVPLSEAATRTLLIIPAVLGVPPVLGLDVVAIAVWVPSDQVAGLQDLLSPGWNAKAARARRKDGNNRSQQRTPATEARERVAGVHTHRSRLTAC